MPVSPKKQSPVGALTSDRPFIQSARPVSQTTASQPVTGSWEMPVVQLTGPVSRFTTSQAPTSTSQKGRPATSVAADVHHQSVTGSGDIPMLQLLDWPASWLPTSLWPVPVTRSNLPLQLLVLPLSIQNLTLSNKVTPPPLSIPLRKRVKCLTRKPAHQNRNLIRGAKLLGNH